MKWPKIGLTSPQVAFLSGAIGFNIISTIQSFYYVKVFLNHYHVSQFGFQISQVIYLIWNALNDPLFAYIQDNAKYACVRTRRHALLYSAPFWGLSFLVFWFPWESEEHPSWITGAHLMVTLVLYDAVFSFIGVAMCALYAEISPKQEDRVLLTRWSAITGIVGSFCLFITEQYSDSLKDFRTFQLLCLVFAICASLLTWYAGKYALTERESSGMSGETRQAEMKDEKKESIWKLTWQIMKNRNFLSFVSVNFAHEFHRTFITNFMAIITESLVPIYILPQYLRSLGYSSRRLITIFLVVVGAPLANTVGYYNLIKGSFLVKIGLGSFLYMFGWSFRSLILLVMVIDSAFASFAFSFFNLSLSDISEDDKQKYNRSVANVSMAFGTNALIMKPVYSIAPMITTALLEARGYGQLKDGTLAGDGLEVLHVTMFRLVCFIPIVVGVLQCFAWSQYSLRNTHKPKVGGPKLI